MGTWRRICHLVFWWMHDFYMQGLQMLKKLTSLNLSGNAIESVGHALDVLTHLEVLRLSGNQLTSLQV